MNEPDRVRVSLNDLRLGATCKFDIRDQRGTLLLAKGRPLTESIRDQILDRGVSFLEVHRDDVHALTAPEAAPAAAPEIRKAERKPRERSSESLMSRRADRSREAYSPARAERFAKNVAAAVGVVARIGEQIQNLSHPDVSELCEIPIQVTEMLLEDADQSIYTISQRDDQLSLPRRCARMSLLAINTGIEMELSEQEVIQLGTAALLHDLGLYLMPEHFRDPTIALGANEAWEYRRHPSLVMNAFARLSIVSDEVRVLANQVHERRDGSGYPRGLHANLIHPLANVLSIVDSYLTLIHPGPGRQAVVPHDAIGFLLFEVGRDLFDAAAMRAFLNQISLFPIGTQVELDSGQRATVIRRDGNHYATPIVRVDGAHTTETVVLRESAHRITRPVVDDFADQMRITTSMMPELNLDMFQPAC